MDYFGIASVSTAYSQVQVQQSVSLSVIKKGMDAQEAQAAALLEMLPPPSESLIDVYA
ncbi:putative motility protein [uncultured Intestinimonas sp.]|uniref:putative motility protein n=1 Tax=uncultured Intestinimonas sp. TaxID=1689265 RepID=UPI0025F54ED4|nr:putative motility protein [uncultured Intestinimonas sp.]